MKSPLIFAEMKAVFLDRDGVINHDPGDYTCRVEDFILLPGTLDALEQLHNKGYKLIIITNQGGIAKGSYTTEVPEEIYKLLNNKCKERGFEMTDHFFCVHHPDFGNCLCRKPGSLMIERALHRYKLDPTQCVMVGDRDRDIEAAAAAGVKGILIVTNDGIIAALDRII